MILVNRLVCNTLYASMLAAGLLAASTPAASAVTTFDELALDNGGGISPFIRWEASREEDFYTVRRRNRIEWWTGNSYNVRFFSSPADTLVVNSDGVNARNLVVNENGPGSVSQVLIRPDNRDTVSIVNETARASLRIETQNATQNATFRLRVPNAGFSHSLTNSGRYNFRDTVNGINPLTIYAGPQNGNVLTLRNGNVGIGFINPTRPLEMASGAYASAGGNWVNASSRALKRNIGTLDAESAREALAALAPVRFEYNNEPGEEHLGFIAEDVPAIVATADRKGLAAMDVVAVLTRVVKEQQAAIERQEATIETLHETASAPFHPGAEKYYKEQGWM